MTSPTAKRAEKRLGARSAARLAATQALYQIEMSNRPPSAVAAEFLQHWVGGAATLENGAVLEGMDRDWFAAIVQGAPADQDLDGMIGASLAKGWSVGRLDPVLRAILRAGLWELLHRPDVPGQVVANEYVEIAHGFFAEREPAVVNAVLDRLSAIVRDDAAG